MFEQVTLSTEPRDTEGPLIRKVPGGWIVSDFHMRQNTYVPDPRVYHNRSFKPAFDEADALDALIKKEIADARR